MLGKAIYQNSNARQTAVMLLWAALCLVFALNAGSIGIAEFMDFIRKNVNSLVAWTWYAMMAASCCIACILTRVLLMIIQGPEVGSLMAILFNAGLAVVISLFLESVDKIDLGTPNTSVEEVILSSSAGYYFYEMFYVHTRKSLEPNLKILAMISATSFIMTSLGNGSGASVVLTFLFLFTSAVPVLKLPYFGSSKFASTTAYKASIWAAYAFAVHQRFIHAPGLLLKFLNSPAFRFEQFECAYYVFLYSLAIGACFGLVEIVHKRQMEEEKKILEDEPLKNESVNRKLVTYNKSKRAYANE